MEQVRLRVFVAEVQRRERAELDAAYVRIEAVTLLKQLGLIT